MTPNEKFEAEFIGQFYPFVQWEALLTGNDDHDQNCAKAFAPFVDIVANVFCEETNLSQDELWPKREYVARLYECYWSATIRGGKVDIFKNLYWEAIVSKFGGEE